ncbi:MAG: hypothetical protein ACFBSD_11065 [Paracoccaceae bacterium]
MRGAAESGLSLLELLVAVSLLGLLGTLAAGGISFGMTAWERSADLGARTVETRAVQRFLDRLISEPWAVRLRDGSRTPPVLFDGRPEALSLVATLPAFLAPPGDRLVALGPLEEGRLGLRSAPLGDRPPEISDRAAVEPLLHGLAAIGFRYFGPDADGTRRWQARWRGRARLPELVEITLVWPGESGRPTARQIVRLGEGTRR